MYICRLMILGIFGFLNMSLADILDILLVAIIIFLVFKWIRGSSAMNVLLVIVLLFLVRLIVEALDMKLMSALMGAFIDIGLLAVIILFQPEIRHFLFKFGENSNFALKARALVDKIFGLKEDRLADSSVRELVDAVMSMSEQKVGALIILTRKHSLTPIIETGDRVDARISSRLIQNIFFKNSPLHDGAMILGGDRIVAARCTLPITAKTNLPAHYGMRHKAAIGVTEEYDAHVIVVSEETGRISYVRSANIQQISGENELISILESSQKEKEAAE